MTYSCDALRRLVDGSTSATVNNGLTLSSTAASGPTCAGGAADEVVTDYDYGPDAGPNNLTLRSTVATATVAGVSTTLRTRYGYDAMGNRIRETRPNANLASCP